MLEIFRKDFIGNALLLIPYCALLRVKSLIYPKALSIKEEYGYFNKGWVEALQDKPLISSIIMIFVISIMAYFINVISNKSMIYHRKTLFPAVLFIFLSSFLDSFLLLSPVHFALIFLLVAFINIISAFKKSKGTAGLIFNTGFFLALASLFYFPFVLFLIFGFISLMTMKSFKFQDRLQYAIGFVIPYVLAMAAFYVQYGKLDFLTHYIRENVTMIPMSLDFSLAQYLAFGVFILMVIYVILQYGNFLSKKDIQVRKNIEILYWIMIFALPGIFFWKHLDLNHFLILVPSLSILIAMSFSVAKNKWTVELVHLMGLGFLYYNHFLI